ncbi:MAG: pyridoxamine 5'-phosphate oxidase [Bdellovibrionaceae bacterium]|nr:pyridoxamine 5'-phosphate oxidase [Pseudobdellovibrionaceae bacterium]
MTQIDQPLQLPPHPLDAFQLWFDDAVRARVPDPTIMTLATATAQGRPDARIVLFKGMSDGGFSFYTNYSSRKARELEANPFAALVFHWQELKRQVRIEGTVIRVSAGESDAYFQSRPRGSQIGAWASPQSEVISDREILIRRVEEAQSRFGEGLVPRPEFWGGYVVQPERIEFWEERPSRLHERIVYQKTVERNGTPQGMGWSQSRLAP